MFPCNDVPVGKGSLTSPADFLNMIKARQVSLHETKSVGKCLCTDSVMCGLCLGDLWCVCIRVTFGM